MLTVGVEEEFLLLDPAGDVAPAAPAVLRLTGPGDERGEIKPELMTYQVETSSGVCTDLGDLEHELTGLRNRIAGAAAEVGVRMVAAAGPPFRDGGWRCSPTRPGTGRSRPASRRRPRAVAPARVRCTSASPTVTWPCRS